MILQAIITRYIGPTNHRGARVKATAAAGSITVHYDSAQNSEVNHGRAALALAVKLKWDGKYVGGGMPDQSGNCYVNAGRACDDAEFEVHRGEMLFLRGMRSEG